MSAPASRVFNRVRTLLLCLFACALSCHSFAQTTWNGGGGDDLWGTGANWGGSSPSPSVTTDIAFAGSTRLTPNNNYTAFDDFRNVLFNTNAGAFTVSGNAIDLFGKIENQGTTAQTFNLTLGVNTSFIEINPVFGDLTLGSPNVFLNANQLRVWGNNGRTLNFTSGSVISGTGGSLAINQNSTVVFNSAHTYTGDTFINAGTLQFNSGGSAASSIIRLGDTNGTASATLAVASGGTANSTIVVRPGSSGVKTLNSTAASGTATVSGSVYLDADATISSTSGGTLSFTGTEFDLKNQTATVNNAGSVSMSTVLKNTTGSGKLTKTGAGTLTLSGANTYSGATTINQGIVALTGGNDRLPTGTTVTFSPSANVNAALNLGGNSQTLATVSGVANTIASTNFVTNGTLTLNGAALSLGGSTNTVFDFSGLTAFTYNRAANSVSLQPNNSVGTGNITNETRLARAGANGGLNTVTASSITVGGAPGGNGVDHISRLRLGTTNLFNSASLNLGAFNARGAVDFQSGLGGAPVLVLRNTSGGATRMTTLKVGETSSGTRPGDGTLDLTGGAIDALVQDTQVGRHLANNSLPNDTSAVTMPGGTLDTITLTLAEKTGSGTPTLTATFTQAGGSVRAGSVILGQATNASGAPVLIPTYNLNGGTLAASNIVSGIGTNSASSVRTLNFNSGTITNYDAGADLTLNGIVVGGGTNFSITLGNTAGTRTFAAASGRTITITNAPIGGGGSLNKDGAGTLVLGSAGTFSGGVTNLQGAITLANSSALGTANVFTFGDNASTKTLSLNGNNATVAGLVTGGTVGTTTVRNGHASAAATLTVNNSASNIFGGVFQSGGAAGLGLTKSGAGTLTLTGGANIFGADILVNAGSLVIDPGAAGGFTNTTRAVVGLATSTAATLAFNSGTNWFTGGSIFGLGDGAGTTVGTMNVSNAVVNIFGALRVLVGNKTTGILNINGGSLNVGLTTSEIVVGGDQSFASANATGIINVNGGALNVTNSGNIILGRTNGTVTGCSGTINLNGGTFTTTRPIWHADNASSGTNNFNGGTLRAAANLTLLTNLTANVRNGGAIIDDGGFAVSLGQGLQHSVITGDNAIDGGLTKTGAGTLTLPAASTYTGPTVINQGTVLANNSSGSATGAGTVTVASGATLGGTGAISGAVMVNGRLSPGTGAGSTRVLTLGSAPTLSGTMLMELNTANTPTADNVTLTSGTLTYGGALVVTNVGALPANGTVFTLFSSPGGYGGSFSSVTLPAGGTTHWKTGNLAVNGTVVFSNNAPVARDVTNSVEQGGVVSIPFTTGKRSLATDADADTLTITSVSSASLGGASTTGTNITYTNTSGSPGQVDTFTYTVSDGFGGTSTGTVAVAITSVTGANLFSATAQSGFAYLTYLGIPGTNYALDWATNVIAPINWKPVATNTALTNGFLHFSNAVSLAPTNDFYRTRYVP